MDQSEARLHLQKMTAGAVQFGHVVAGINAGLFDAIGRHGEAGISVETLSRELDYFEDYVRVWCETAYAIHVLDHAGNGNFRLAEGFENLLTTGAAGSLSAIFRMTEIFVEERLELPEFMRTGKVRTFQDHGERLSKVIGEVTAGGTALAIEHIYRGIPEVSQRLQEGARLLEVGCGMGGLVSSLAKQFPETTFVGLDCDSYAIEIARRDAEVNGLQRAVRFQQNAAESIDFREEFDIVSLNLVMHELRAEIRPQAVRRMWQALKPGGVLISNDFYYPSSLEDFRKQEHQGAIGDQAAEVIWGNRHLSREQLAELFAECGFGESQFHVIQMPDQPFPRLTALAFK